ncbi:MAG: serine protease SohB, partial [Bermanella sp.]
MEFLSDYGLFLAKAITFVVVVAMIVGLIASAGQKAKPEKLSVRYLNDKLEQSKQMLQEKVLSKKELKALKKEQKKASKEESSESRSKVYVLNFNGDIKASQSEQLKDEITALLNMGDHVNEVVVK